MRRSIIAGAGFTAAAFICPAGALAAPVTLVCEGMRPDIPTWTFVLDVEAHTAWGGPATVSEKTVEWLDPSDHSRYTLDRFSGALTNCDRSNCTQLYKCHAGAKQF